MAEQGMHPGHLQADRAVLAGTVVAGFQRDEGGSHEQERDIAQADPQRGLPPAPVHSGHLPCELKTVLILHRMKTVSRRK